MTKKAYIKPESQAYEVETRQMLAGSPSTERIFDDDTVPADENEDMW